jgi:hypothetical protein
MALSNAEKQRNWRQREREKQEAARRVTAVMPVAEHEEKLERYKARVAAWRDKQLEAYRAIEAEVSRLAGELEAAHEELAATQIEHGKRCQTCGGELACPRCYRGEDF